MRKTSLAFILLLSLAALLASCDLVLPGNDTPLKYTVTYYTSSLGDKVLIAYECNLGYLPPLLRARTRSTDGHISQRISSHSTTMTNRR